MKKILLISSLIILSTKSFAAPSSGKAAFNSSSWSLLWGYTENNNSKSYNPQGRAYKFQSGFRWDNNTEVNFMVLYGKQKDDITYSGTQGDIERTQRTIGINFGVWVFSALKLHAGYAYNGFDSVVNGSYTSTQVTSIKTQYDLKSSAVKGLYGGADVVLLQNSMFQLFTNVEYFHLNHLDSFDWEAMVGLRFYPGSSSSKTPGWFDKLFEWVLSPK